MNFSRTISYVFPIKALSFNINSTIQQIRTKWVNRWMIRDVKRRKLLTEYAPMRLRVNALRRNDILPPEIRELADAQIQSFPLDSTPLRINKRCVLTSRPKGVVHRWRLSRMVFRNLADYNKLAGIQRAMW